MSIVAGLLIMSGSVISAVAPSAAGERRVIVRHCDLDLRRAADVARLHRRIVSAVSRVCESPNRMTLAEAAQRTSCRNSANQQAFAKMRIAVAAAEADGTQLAQR